MYPKLIRVIVLFLITSHLFTWGCLPTAGNVQAAGDRADLAVISPAEITGVIFDQPVDPIGLLYISAWLDPDGSNNDMYVWDNFTLQTGGTITEIDWIGGYDPSQFGAGGPVLDFRVEIYPSIPAGTEPAIAYPPLVQYQTGGNAGETSIGLVNGTYLYTYAFTLPAAFVATAGEKYWVQIEAFQKGTNPDWGISSGTGGNSSHYLRGKGAGGDIMYRTVPGDAAFSLSGTAVSGPNEFNYLPIMRK